MMKPSISSRTSVRSLIVACLPATALGVMANSPVLGAVFDPLANQGSTVDDKDAASPSVPSTNSSNATNNYQQPPICISGARG